jgi:lipid-binding SYLF domain-containing protein
MNRMSLIARPFRIQATLLLCALASLGAALPAAAQTREEARLITATSVLEEFHDSPDQRVPDWLVERAYGVAVIPSVIKGAIGVGGRYGTGVMTVRDEAGRFSSPVFLSLTGGSVGWQIGAQATDVILVFVTRRSVQNFASGQFTLGASASVAAGPLGRSGEAAAGKDAEIYSYSRARGLFAGVAFDGSVLRVEKKANRNFYGRDVSSDEIFSGKLSSNSEAARRFIATIASMLPATAPGAKPTQPAVSTSLPPAAAPAPTPSTPAAGAQSFPLEDAKPGGEPR